MKNDNLIKQYKEFNIDCEVVNGTVQVTAFVRDNIQYKQVVGSVHFFHYKKDIYISSSVWVDEKFQKRGIAKEMYQFAYELGYNIKPSPMQTTLGKKMWQSFRRQGVLFAKETVFERSVRKFKELMDH